MQDSYTNEFVFDRKQSTVLFILEMALYRLNTRQHACLIVHSLVVLKIENEIPFQKFLSKCQKPTIKSLDRAAAIA